MWAFIVEEEGATAIEYGLIAALVGVAIIGSLQLLAKPMRGTYDMLAYAVGP